MKTDEAAKRLGLHWRTVREAMLQLGWLAEVGRGIVRCTHVGMHGQFVEPITTTRRRIGGEPVTVETGFGITETGLRELARFTAALPRRQ